MKTTDFLNRRASTGPRNAGGFTILEGMIAVALVAIMTALAAPSVVEFVRSNQLSTAAYELDADILLARREAIKRSTRVLLCVAATTANTCSSGTAWAGGWLVCYDTDQDGACDSSTSSHPNPIRQHAKLDSGITLTGPSTAARFNSNGTQGAAGSRSLTFTTRGSWTGSKSYVETVTANGAVSMATGG